MTAGISIFAQMIRSNRDESFDYQIEGSVYLQAMQKEILRRKFEKLAGIWKLETAFLSNSHDIINNSAYKKIIGLGPNVLEFILEDLKNSDHFWFYALQQITNVNPIKPENKGIFKQMKNDWILWHEHNFD